MINMGIDFGSTYTIASVLKNGDPTVVKPHNNSDHYPSVVCYDTVKERYFFGNAARNMLGEPDVLAFRGFKMLLAQEPNEEILKDRGYVGENTPEYITELYLKHVISDSLKKKKEDKVDLLVIGAPECWFQSMRMVDARGALRKICQNICKSGLVNRFELRSEPTDAAAFCAWGYEQNTGKQFSGKIMVIDYGGGTLDTALVNVEHINGKIQIKPEILSGIGENHDQELGKAGIAYQEAVVRRAISEARGIPEAEVQMDSSFAELVKSFEDNLLSKSDYVDEIFEEYEAVPDNNLKRENFLTLKNNDEKIPVDFAQMKAVYKAVISPALEKVLNESTMDMEEDTQPYLALVGGFCNFYLVRQQIRNYFKSGILNLQSKTLIFSEEDSERAIGYGACLLANHVLEVCHVASFGIGMCVCYGGVEGKYFKRYAISYGQEYVPNRIYFAKDVKGNVVGMMLTQADKFLLNFFKKDEYGKPATPKPAIAKRLQSITQKPSLTVIGFSIDEAERITIHVFDYHRNVSESDYGTKIKCKKMIPLETFKESFNNILYSVGE